MTLAARKQTPLVAAPPRRAAQPRRQLRRPASGRAPSPRASLATRAATSVAHLEPSPSPHHARFNQAISVVASTDDTYFVPPKVCPCAFLLCSLSLTHPARAVCTAVMSSRVLARTRIHDKACRFRYGCVPRATGAPGSSRPRTSWARLSSWAQSCDALRGSDSGVQRRTRLHGRRRLIGLVATKEDVDRLPHDHVHGLVDDGEDVGDHGQKVCRLRSSARDTVIPAV